MRETKTRNAPVASVGLALAAALSLAAGTPDLAWAGDEVFTVANYPVEARAENAVAAKDRALADGQRAALRSLLKRLVPVTAHQRLRRLPPMKAGDLIEGVRVRSERNSATDYIASLDFAFQSKGVRDLLRREGLPFIDEQAPTLTVVPIWRASGARGSKEEAAWTNVWKGLDLDHALTPVKLEALKSGIAPGTVEALAGGDGAAIRSLVAAYGRELILLAVAEEDTAAGRLHVTLVGRDAVGAFILKRAYRLDPVDPGYTSELAAVVSLGILEGRWKAIRVSNSASSGGGGPAAGPGASYSLGGGDMLIAVEFQGMSEWQDISRRLSSLPGVEELEVAGLSARGARVTLRYAEGPERLADALAEQGLSLRSAGGNWVLRIP